MRLFRSSLMALTLLVPAVLVAAPPAAAAAANYYVDCSASASGSGTQAAPWNSFTPVNARTFAAGDQILIKRGTTCANQQLFPKGSAHGSPRSWRRLRYRCEAIWPQRAFVDVVSSTTTYGDPQPGHLHTGRAPTVAAAHHPRELRHRHLYRVTGLNVHTQLHQKEGRRPPAPGSSSRSWQTRPDDVRRRADPTTTRSHVDRPASTLYPVYGPAELANPNARHLWQLAPAEPGRATRQHWSRHRRDATCAPTQTPVETTGDASGYASRPCAAGIWGWNITTPVPFNRSAVADHLRSGPSDRTRAISAPSTSTTTPRNGAVHLLATLGDYHPGPHRALTISQTTA